MSLLLIFCQCVHGQTHPESEKLVSTTLEKLFESGGCQTFQGIFECTGKLADNSYPKLTTLYFSENLNPKKPLKLSLYFHGHRTPNSKFEDDVLNRFHFDDQLKKINDTQMIIAVPHSVGKNDDHETYFGETLSSGAIKHPSRLPVWLSELTDSMESSGICKSCHREGFSELILSGHSGAYTVLYGIIAEMINKNLSFSRINFIDAMYTIYEGRYNHVKNALKNDSELRIRILSLSSTQSATNKMEAYLKSDPSIKSFVETSRNGIPDSNCYEQPVCFHYPTGPDLTHISIVNQSFYWLTR